LYEGSCPTDIEQKQSKQAARACDAAFTAAHSTALGAALEALAAATCCCPDAVSSALLQYPQGLQALLELVCSGSDSGSCCNSSSNTACMAFMALSVLWPVTGAMCWQQDRILAALATEEMLQLLLQALLRNSSFAADLLCRISQAPEVQRQLLPSVVLLLGVVCGQEASLEVRTTAAVAVANLGHNAEGKQAAAAAVWQHSVGALLQLLQQQSSPAALASAVAWILEAASTAPTLPGHQLLLP
jgi:hypothetical protein